MFSRQTFAIRRDLLSRSIRMGEQLLWVTKDPLARRYYYFNEQEFAILQWLDGSHSVSEICSNFSRRFAPLHLSQKRLLLFLAQLAQAELLKGVPASGSAHSGLSHRIGSAISNPLAIRLPGIHPARILEVLYPLLSWVFTPAAGVAAVLLLFSALACAVVRFETYVSSLPAASAWATPELLVTTLLVIAGIKIIHELSHALTARHFGAHCESIGVMFLVFVPCLYCDVSDAWMLRSRRARIAISAAGIVAELLLASLATLLWMTATEGPVKSVLATVMIVCSVNTLLFNGNPLMKYDGYFILSDLVGIPNLAGEAAARLRNRLRFWIWGERPPDGARQSPREVAIIRTYGVLSTLYRTLIISLILYGLYRFFDGQGLSVVGTALAAGVLAMMLSRFVPGIARPPSGFRFRDPRAVARLGGVTAVLLAVLAGVCLVPLPQRVDAPFRIESRLSREVFVSVPGQLLFAVEHGQQVRKGDVLARLQNHSVQRELQKLDVALASLRNQRRGFDARRGLLESADELPSLLEAIAALERRRSVLERELSMLTIPAPGDGTVFEPPNAPARFVDPRLTEKWSGTPLDEQNRNCFLERGTPLCAVGDPADQVATLYVSQRRVQRVRPGQTVRLWFPGVDGGGLDAEVIEISPSPIDEVPREILAKRLIPVELKSEAPGPMEPVYRVVARLARPDSGIPLRATGRASIRVRSATLANHIVEFVQEAFDI